MTKAEILRFLEPFADDVEFFIWSAGRWLPIELEAEVSPRTGNTNIWVTPKPWLTSESEERA